MADTLARRIEGVATGAEACPELEGFTEEADLDRTKNNWLLAVAPELRAALHALVVNAVEAMTLVGAESFRTVNAASMTWQPMSPIAPAPKSCQARHPNG